MIISYLNIIGFILILLHHHPCFAIPAPVWGTLASIPPLGMLFTILSSDRRKKNATWMGLWVTWNPRVNRPISRKYALNRWNTQLYLNYSPFKIAYIANLTKNIQECRRIETPKGRGFRFPSFGGSDIKPPTKDNSEVKTLDDETLINWTISYSKESKMHLISPFLSRNVTWWLESS